jgi:hypothetical protein
MVWGRGWERRREMAGITIRNPAVVQSRRPRAERLESAFLAETHRTTLGALARLISGVEPAQSKTHELYWGFER